MSNARRRSQEVFNDYGLLSVESMLVELYAEPLNLNSHSLACASKATCRPQMYTCSLQGFEQPAMFVKAAGV